MKVISAPKERSTNKLPAKSSSKSSVGMKMFSAKIGRGTLYGWRHVTYESKGFFIGGGGGKFTDLSGPTPVTTSCGGVVIEPWLGLDWRVGRHSNMNLGFSQISMPNNENFTGPAVSLRVDFKLH